MAHVNTEHMYGKSFILKHNAENVIHKVCILLRFILAQNDIR